jgi:NADPH:quinone reductase-like Zn-dependent oxidoreductase
VGEDGWVLSTGRTAPARPGGGRPAELYLHSLKPGGIYVTVDLGFMYHAPLVALITRFVGSRRAKVGIGRYRREDLLLVKDLVETGKYRPVIGRRYALDEVVEATRDVETVQKTGNVVLRVSEAAPGAA